LHLGPELDCQETWSKLSKSMNLRKRRWPYMSWCYQISPDKQRYINNMNMEKTMKKRWKKRWKWLSKAHQDRWMDPATFVHQGMWLRYLPSFLWDPLRRPGPRYVGYMFGIQESSFQHKDLCNISVTLAFICTFTSLLHEHPPVIHLVI